jgi:hypothetical protein
MTSLSLRRRSWLVKVACVPLFLLARPAAADEPSPSNAAPTPAPVKDCGALCADEVFARHVGVEVNVLWPFVPGIFEFRVMIPVLRRDQRDWRGELVTGAYADYASWLVRGSEYGKVRNLSGKLGYRQFFVYGLHAEISANIGWRDEEGRPPSGNTTYPSHIDGFASRLWVYLGYEHEFSRTLYANARGAFGVNIYRSDDYAYLEKTFSGGGDVNLGVRF